MALAITNEDYEQLAIDWEQRRSATLIWLAERGYTPDTCPVRLAVLSQPNPYTGGVVTKTYERRMNPAYRGKVNYAEKYGKRIIRR